MWKPYLAFAKKSFLGRSAYRFEHWMGIFDTCLQIFIFWGIYKSLYGGRTQVDGITLSAVTTNFVLSMGLGAAFSVNENFLPSKIRDGSIANELLRPVSFQGRMLAEDLGTATFDLLFRFVPALLIAVLTIGIQAPAGGEMFLYFTISAALGYGVLWTIGFVTQMAAFWLINIWSLRTIKNVFVRLLSGSMLPLWFMPDWMSGMIHYTPFSSIYFTPVQIYLGQLSNGEIVGKCAIQAAWIGGLYLFGILLWQRGKRKLVVQGG